MDSLPRPDVILTHESDLDGFMAGHLLVRLARKLFGIEPRLEAWNSQAWRQRPVREKCAWVCDFAFEPRLDQAGWVVIDHHQTATQPARAVLRHDPGKSAALLCYELCQQHGLGSPELDRLVRLTNVGDLFLEDDPAFEEAQDYAALLKAYSFWNLSRLVGGSLESLLEHPLLEVVRTKRRVEDPIGLAWSRGRVTRLAEDVGWVDVAVGNSNLIVHALLRDPANNYRVLLTMNRKASSGVSISLRSRNGEALALARRLQGGGHPNAAGATLPRSVQNLPDAVDYLRGLLDPAPATATSLEGALGGLRLDGAAG